VRANTNKWTIRQTLTVSHNHRYTLCCFVIFSSWN